MDSCRIATKKEIFQMECIRIKIKQESRAYNDPFRYRKLSPCQGRACVERTRSMIQEQDE